VVSVPAVLSIPAVEVSRAVEAFVGAAGSMEVEGSMGAAGSMEVEGSMGAAGSMEVEEPMLVAGPTEAVEGEDGNQRSPRRGLLASPQPERLRFDANCPSPLPSRATLALTPSHCLSAAIFASISGN
jgi:hypothetical protein